MLIFTLVLTALGAWSALASSGIANPHRRSAALKNRFAKKQLDAERTIPELFPRDDDRFLTSKTESKSYQTCQIRYTMRQRSRLFTYTSIEFAVNGTGLPEVDFDIGESYAGRLPITTQNSANSSLNELFFWFFPSDNPLASNEIVIWLNGGPGCSSMDGLLQESGPFLWQSGTYSAQPNPFSWTNLTNIIYIDQPIGTGMSRWAAGAPSQVKDETDVATQFAGFWQNFINTFDMQGVDIYITGESYAGMVSTTSLCASDWPSPSETERMLMCKSIRIVCSVYREPFP